MTGRHLELDRPTRQRLERVFGEAIASQHRVRWGTGTPTTLVELASGRRLIVQRHGRRSAARVQRASVVLGDGGLPVPRVDHVVHAGRRTFVAFQSIEGAPAAEQFGTPHEERMAAAMGEALGLLRRVRAGAMSPERAWATPGHLRAAAAHWLEGMDHDRTVAKAVASQVDRLAARRWQPAVSHGDYVPANALMNRGRLAALVDLADVAPRHPLVDPAWWLLVVRHHHPGALPAVEGPFVTRALDGLVGADRADRADLPAVAVLRALERLVMSPAGARRHHRDILETSLSWAADEQGLA